MALVKDFKVQNTRIKIYDDACAKTAEENKAILDRIAAIAARQEKERMMKLECKSVQGI